jgi:hypothetical protein
MAQPGGEALTNSRNLDTSNIGVMHNSQDKFYLFVRLAVVAVFLVVVSVAIQKVWHRMMASVFLDRDYYYRCGKSVLAFACRSSSD